MRCEPSICARSLRRGFTLLELVIVVVLIAIMTALIAPEMRGTFEGEVLRATSRKLIQCVNLAHSRTISGNVQHRLVIDPIEQVCRIERLARNADEGVGFLPMRDDAAVTGELDSRVRIEVRETPRQPAGADGQVAPAAPRSGRAAGSETRRTIAFHPDGTADGVDILLRDGSGFGLMLRVNPVTAGVKVTELAREGAK